MTFTRPMYQSPYKMVMHGFTKMALDTLARPIRRRSEPAVKVH